MDLRDQLQSTLGEAYTLERELGGGGMSRVFLAEECQLCRRVVVKVLSPELAADVSFERFAREIRLAASLQQANIVPLLTAGETFGLPFYTMPYVEGQSLRHRLSASGPLSIREAINVLRDVARALAFAHEHGVIHRDIKPENVLLSGDAAVVTDFGIAKALSASRNVSGDVTITSVGVGMGTPAYSAPEQALGDPACDHRADLYSFGCLAFEVLVGRPPFAGQSAHVLIAAHLNETPPAVSSLRPEIPAGLSSLIARCLAKDPAARPQQAREILEALDTVDTPTLTLDARPAPPRPPQRRRWAALGVLVVAIGIALVARRVGGSAGTPRALAVMPFTNIGGDSSQQYFADGIVIDLTNALSRVPGLRVTSRSLAFSYRGRSDVRQLARELNVDAVVDGAVQRAAGHLRVTCQLVRTADGVSLWSKEFDRDAKDLFAVQDTIAKEIMSELRLTLATSGERPAVAGTASIDAYEAYLRGVFLLEHRGPGVAKSVDYFRDAIARDSGFARAYGALSEALELLPYFSATPAASVEARAVIAAQRALALDSTNADAHIGLALARDHAFKWRDGEVEFRRAIHFDSTSANAHLQYGRQLMQMGRIGESLAEFRLAARLDPLSGTAAVHVAHLLSLSGLHDSAMSVHRHAREVDPGLGLGRTLGAADAVAAGHSDLARSLASGMEGEPGWRGQAAFALGQAGDTAAARAIIRDLERVPSSHWFIHTGRTYALMGVGDTARALTELEAALAAHETTPTWNSFSDRIYDGVRHTPRFAVIVHGFGLDERLLTSPFGGRPAK